MREEHLVSDFAGTLRVKFGVWHIRMAFDIARLASKMAFSIKDDFSYGRWAFNMGMSL